MRPALLVRRALIFVHRWLGVALSGVVLLWFASGIVMMYRGFPAVTARDRLERSPPLTPETIHISPEQAAAALGRGADVARWRLTTFDGRAIYRFGEGEGGRDTNAVVYADDGTVQRTVDNAAIDRAATAWSGRPLAEARREVLSDVDQWTVGGLRAVRPLFKYSWPDGQQVYVNGRTGAVAQYTTTASRFWAYLGAIPHWLYFTPLRKHQALWSSLVVWSSLVATVAALLGLVIGIWMYSPGKRYRHAGVPTGIPYRGWKRWHAVIGLSFGVVTLTWTFSGLLSMGPFPIMNRLADLAAPAAAAPGLADALRGPAELQLSAYAARSPREAIAAIPGFGAREVEASAFAGEPIYIVANGRGETRLIPVRGEAMTTLDPEEVMRVIRNAAGRHLAELRVMDRYDAYYLDRRGERPLPVVYVRFNDPAGTRYYVDLKTGRIVGEYSARGWVDRWLYGGLHSFSLPWLYTHRPLWDITVIALMLGGTALAATSCVLAWRLLARHLRAMAGRGVANEDLV